ncbi:MAG: CRISPR-associated protein Cas4 [Patescibacteria group bacterium]|uniref:CRISPR-associated protein Cas4 n=1 Tax=Thermonema sp. TaxID=2231181 RepID=UPI0021DC420D|nr:CRISPR-associated protein Cas4 [Thermonema sp.]GIV39351.1 MAG: CRISPR-associated protein Cas4 [Thermonema sp.]GIW61084.1 MAG: CRISPR-associated protein Cas4 [Patescibacteria group bacterium]
MPPITITAVLMSYYLTCPRRMWLFHHHIRMEHNSDLVYAGKLVDEHSYGRRSTRDRQLELRAQLCPGVQLLGVLDYLDTDSRTIHETKKSDRKEEAHIAQLRFYQLLLKENGMEGCRGIIEYPLLRSTTEVPPLDAATEARLRQELHAIVQILRDAQCPPLQRSPLCRQCAYYDYCYIDETE